MDLNRVAAFVRVVDEGSFTAAARTMGLPKSSVSRSVAHLEEDLGFRLLHRTTRRLELTDAGAAFHDRVSRALADIGDATAAAADMHTQLRGAVRITAPNDVGVVLLAPILTRFAKKHPEIRVDLELTGRIVDLVAERFDLAVRAGQMRDTSLIGRRIGELESRLYASPKFLARRGMPASLEDVPKDAFVLFRPVNGTTAVTLSTADGRQATLTATGALGSDDLAFVRRAVIQGAGIGLLPDILCGREVQRGRLVRVAPEWMLRGAILHLVYPSARYVPHRVVVLREFLLTSLGKAARRCDALRETAVTA